jgi:hypothetical protein
MTTQDRSVTARRIVLGFVGLNAAIILAAIVISICLPPLPSAEEYVFAYSWILTSIVYSGLAVLIIFRQPRHTVGWLFAVIGFLNATTLFGIITAEYLELSIFELPLRSEQAQIMYKIITELIWILGLFLPLTLMLQFFPDGRLPSRRWWPITLATILGFLSLAVEFAVEEAGYAGPFAWLADLAVIFMLIGILGSLAAVLLRFIRSQDTERLQMKWLVYTAVVGVLLMFLFVFVLDEDNPILGFYTTLLPSLLAIAVGIAILRHRLYDIDIIIRRTLQYGIVTGLLALVYFGLVVIFQSLFVAIGDTESSIFIVISTLVVAGLFNPLRLRVQKAIDRRFYRKKYQAEQVLSQFATAARDEVDLDKLTGELLEVVRETMQPESVSLFLISDDR